MNWHELWQSEARPHNTFSSIMRRKSRLQYHYAVKCIVKNKDSIRSANMAKNSLIIKKRICGWMVRSLGVTTINFPK